VQLAGRAVAERFVQPRVVYPAEVLDDDELKLYVGAPDASFGSADAARSSPYGTLGL